VIGCRRDFPLKLSWAAARAIDNVIDRDFHVFGMSMPSATCKPKKWIADVMLNPFSRKQRARMGTHSMGLGEETEMGKDGPSRGRSTMKYLRCKIVYPITVVVGLCFVAWGKHAYLMATIVHIERSVRSLPIDNKSTGRTDEVPALVSYYITPRVGSTNYLTACDLNVKCGEWHEGDSVGFRQDKKAAFITPRKGKDVRVRFLTSTSASAGREH
jgi:hypothetical protein